MRNLTLLLFANGLAACAAPQLSLEEATARTALDGRLIAVAVLPQCCRPCALDAREQLKDPELTEWLARRAWLVEYDPERDEPGLPCWEVGPEPALTLARADGHEAACSSWDEESRERLRRFEEFVTGDESRSVRRLEAYARGENPSARQARARALAERGEPARALDEYLWCFDYGVDVDSAYCGVRVSFLLSALAEFAKTYPPAAAALDERMARAEVAIERDPGNFDAWEELTSIAYWHRAGERVLACVERLDHRHPLRVKIRLRLLDKWLPLLLRSGRHADVLWLCAGSPLDVATHWMTEFETTREMLERWLDEICEDDDAEGPFGVTPRQFSERLAEERLSVASKVAGLYTAELALERDRSAQKLFERTVVFAPAAAVYVEFAGRAEALQRDALAVRILRDGLAALPEAETTELAAQLQRLEADAR